eukprot:jgi/Picre1/29127/NNA_004520.t1
MGHLCIVGPKGVARASSSRGSTTTGVLVSARSFMTLRRRSGSVFVRSSDPDQQMDRYEPKRLDDVDKLLLSVKHYVQHPDKAVRDFWTFVVESIGLMRHVYKPKLVRESLWRSIVVLIVVAVFCCVVVGMDACLQLLPAAIQS